MLDETMLLTDLRAGKDAAFEELVRSYGPRLLSVARRFMKNDEDAQDVLQDSFISAFRSLGRFEGQSKLSTWLHRIVVNASLMKIRSQKRRPETSIEELLPQFLEDGHHVDMPSPWKSNPHEELESSETRTLVQESIGKLPESYRTVLLLRDIEGLDTEETAKMLGISSNAAKIRLHRARLALREVLDPHMRGDA